MFTHQEDLRVRRTHKLLWEALMALLTERAFGQITVKEICERAMVHRTTFYMHYADKDALLEQGIHHMHDALIAEVDVPPHVFSIDHPPPYFVHLFTHVAEHQHFYQVMLCGEGVGRFQKLFKEYLVENAEIKIRAFSSKKKQPPFPPAFHAQYLAGAVISTLAWWLENDLPYSPRHMAQYLFEIQRIPRKE